MSLSIIVASSGRPTLQRTLDSIEPFLEPGDELLLDVNSDAPWGHKARNRQMQVAKGDWLAFQDDDDVYLPGAFDVVRAGVATAPGRVHMFRMRFHSNGSEIWTDQEVRCGNVSTQMVVVPNCDRLGRWDEARYEGDFCFIRDTCEMLGEPVWHEPVIALYRPA